MLPAFKRVQNLFEVQWGHGLAFAVRLTGTPVCKSGCEPTCVKSRQEILSVGTRRGSILYEVATRYISHSHKDCVDLLAPNLLSLM